MLMSRERMSWQDPYQIIDAIGITLGSTVADLGCGPGYFVIPAAQKVSKTGRVFAVDSNPSMLEHLRNNLADAGINEGIEIIESNLPKIGIPDETVDFVLIANVLHDIEDKAALLEETKRIARPECLIVDIDWHRRESEIGPPLDLRLSEQDSRKIIRNNGLEIVYSIDAGKYHYGLVCKKIKD